ncbi:uncharacterized protein TNCV_1553801 [Trichonephila clavipes]|nr:uncharacterized protein TNCV_1553801 [Trichonephila clavipes]
MVTENPPFRGRSPRAKEEAAPQILCPLCQVVDLAVETNKMCGDCGKNFCQKCGTFVPGEGRAESMPEPDEIGNLIEAAVDVAGQIYLEVDSDDVQELLDTHNQELTMDELIEISEQERDI